MKNYIVTHTFKSKEAKAKMIEVTGSMSMEDMTKAMTSENAKCQMSWNTPGDNLTMFCWWKGTDPDASGSVPFHQQNIVKLSPGVFQLI